MTENTPKRGVQTRSLILGIALGALVPLGWSMMHRPKAVPMPPAPTAEGDLLKISAESLEATRFESEIAKESPPLPRPPVTARVAAIETRTAPSYAPLDGRIERVAVRLGDRVEEGARLVLVRSGELATMLRELHTQQASATTRRSLVQRMQKLVDARGASENELLVARNDLHEAELASRAADFRLHSLLIAQEGENLYWMLAARAGTVIELNATPGGRVRTDQEKPVATIADLSEVLVLADVPPLDTTGLRVGAAVQIRMPGVTENPATGSIETISEVVDQSRQTVPIRVRVDNQDRKLRPNAFVEAVLTPDPQRRIVVVPADSVVSDGLQSVVFSVEADGRFRRRPVTIGRQYEGNVEIANGIKSGERVVTRGALLLLNALDIAR